MAAFVTLGGALATAVLVAEAGVGAGLALAGLPAVAAVLAMAVRAPVAGLYAAVAVSFFGPGLSRYAPAPTGLLLDGFLALTLAVVLLRAHADRYDLTRLKTPFVFAALAWLGLTALQLANPIAPGSVAWLYAGRGTTFYLVLTSILASLLLRRRAHLDRLLWLWLGLSLVGTLWGVKQLILGLDAAEQAWLSSPGNQSTHVLLGRLRVFSFYSDAGQFGAAQGFAGIVALILALGPFSRRRRLLYALLGLAGIYGLLISGTRGAMAVPAAGAVVYLMLSRNVRMMALGALGIVALYSVLMFTYVGSSNYTVHRFRMALRQGTDNPSFQVRLENQERLRAWLADHPFGGGVGAAGSWGQRFAPGTFLADLSLDSWYVRIAAEHGRFVLWLYVLGVLGVLAGAARRLLRVKDLALRHTLLALLAGAVGIAVASYGNQVLGQMPTAPFVYVCVAACYLAPWLEREGVGARAHDGIGG